MFLIEEYPVQNPNKNKSTDTFETLNIDFLEQATRALITITYSFGNAVIYEGEDTE